MQISGIGKLSPNRKRLKTNCGATRNDAQGELKDLDESFIRKFREVVEADLSDSRLSIDWIGDKMGMSRVQVYRKVKALLGSSPSDVIKESRMRKAQSMLQGGAASVTDVAYRGGFTSPS